MLFGLSWGLGPDDVDGVGRWTQSGLRDSKARHGYERLCVQNRFEPVSPWFGFSLESELVSSGED